MSVIKEPLKRLNDVPAVSTFDERRQRGEKVKGRQATRREVLQRLALLAKTDVPTLLDAIGAPDPDVIDRMVDDDVYETRLI